MFSLKELFDKQVVVTLDPSWKGSGSSLEDKLWCYEIVGKRGKLYPQTVNSVCVCTTLRIAKRLLSLFGDKAQFKRRSDDEMEIVIPVSLVQSTFRYIKPTRRRVSKSRLTPLIQGVPGPRTADLLQE